MAFNKVIVNNPEILAERIQFFIKQNPAGQQIQLSAIEMSAGEFENLLNKDDAGNSTNVIDLQGNFDAVVIVQAKNKRTLIVNLPNENSNKDASDAALAGNPPFDDVWYPMPDFYSKINSLFWNNKQPDNLGSNAEKEEARKLRVGEYCINHCL